MNMVRRMLKGKNLLKEIWEEVVSTTAYLLNRCPTKKLENVTLEEAWSGLKPNLNHLKVFGFIAYRHAPCQLIKKLDDKGGVIVLVGYHSLGGYKPFDTVNRRIIIIRDVVTGYQQVVTGYQNPVTSYRFEILDSKVARSTQQHAVKSRDEGNVRRSTRQRGLSQRLQDCELFRDNDVNDDGDFVHFALMTESKPVNMEEALSDPKWIYSMKEEM